EATFQRLSQEGRGCSVYLLGGKPGVARRAGLMLRRKYNAVSIAGTLDGYFGDDHAADIAAQIGSAAPDILLVGLGFPKQEKFIAAFKAVCRAKVSIGCGGSLDVFAGEVARAPRLVRRLGLEWLYRLAKQPSRLGRMMALPVFALLIIRDKFRRHKV
ncbi:MAG: WecB/TagA/CpsF family glycosyltransferase, partial [Defluviitaleaceae bacterium]|nr:WecB/TagA/CpsF family glycosyltransferase [Defluviitaleaceae bacterium]